MYYFQHRYVPGHEPPLKPGRYTAKSDWYDVDRPPRVGERCTDYVEYVRQTGRIVRSARESLVVER